MCCSYPRGAPVESSSSDGCPAAALSFLLCRRQVLVVYIRCTSVSLCLTSEQDRQSDLKTGSRCVGISHLARVRGSVLCSGLVTAPLDSAVAFIIPLFYPICKSYVFVNVVEIIIYANASCFQCGLPDHFVTCLLFRRCTFGEI